MEKQLNLGPLREAKRKMGDRNLPLKALFAQRHPNVEELCTEAKSTQAIFYPLTIFKPFLRTSQCQNSNWTDLKLDSSSHSRSTVSSLISLKFAWMGKTITIR